MKRPFSWLPAVFASLFAGGAQPAAAADQTAFEKNNTARDAHWAKAGQVEKDVLAPLVNPAFMGRPKWPGLRQAFRVVRRGDSLLVATDGLSDPSDDDPAATTGLSLELFIETRDIPAELKGKEGEIARLRESWALRVLSHVADTVVEAGGILPMLEKYDVISMELPGVSQAPDVRDQVPARFVTRDDALGILIGKPDPDFPKDVTGASGPIRLVPIVIVTATELEALRKGGPDERRALAARLATTGGHRSDLSRESATP